MNEVMRIRGARTHNLKNIDVDIPLNTITCLYGPSGSGKSSLAFHTIHAESKRRYINSFPSDIKFFWEVPQAADVDEIYPVLPVWGLPQNNPVIGSRPVVLDLIGGLEDSLRVFYYLGKRLCPEHGIPLGPSKLINQIEVLGKEKSFQEGEVLHFFVDSAQYRRFMPSGLFPSRSMDAKGDVTTFSEEHTLWEIFRVKWGKLEKLSAKLKEFPQELISKLTIYRKNSGDTETIQYQETYSCPECGHTDNFTPSSEFHLSPFNALGACSSCSGYGMNLIFDPDKLVQRPDLTLKEGAVTLLDYKRFAHLKSGMLREAKKRGFDVNTPFEQLEKEIWDFLYEGSGGYPGFNTLFGHLESKRYKRNVRIFIRKLQSEEVCLDCQGSRFASHAYHRVLAEGDESMSLGDFSLLDIESGAQELAHWVDRFPKHPLATSALKRLRRKFDVAIKLGVGHLGLGRRIKTLSPGEYQRILLNKFLSFEGSGGLFIFDEPSLGLGLKEQRVLMKYFRELNEQGNTILLVDHSEYLRSQSHEVIQMGPHAGGEGGQITYQGKYQKEKEKTEKISPPAIKEIQIHKAKAHGWGETEKTIQFPDKGILTVSGPSGSGKTSYLIQALANELSYENQRTRLTKEVLSCEFLSDVPEYQKVLLIDSSMSNLSSRSTVGTYVGIAPYLRKHFANLPASKAMGLREGHFSPNSPLGKCPTCEGRGVIQVEMSFLEDVEYTCDDCKGMKIRPLYAQISDGLRTYYESVNVPCREVFEQISLTPKLRRLRDLFQSLKLDYLNLDRPLSSLSGGERQRLKLLGELQGDIQSSALFFENLSFGLSRRELDGLGKLLKFLAGKDNLIVIIDQHPYFSEFANYTLDFTSTGDSPSFHRSSSFQ